MKIKASAIALALLLLSLSACSVAETDKTKPTEGVIEIYEPTEKETETEPKKETEINTEKETEIPAEKMTQDGTYSQIIDPENDFFTEKENGNVVSNTGIEYEEVVNEDEHRYWGKLKFEGSIKGELENSQFYHSFQTGMYAIENDETKNILIRKYPDSELYSIYRKTSLPKVDFSIENCDRLELVLNRWVRDNDVAHITCGDGITDKAEIAEFLSDIRSQKDPHRAGLYDLIAGDEMYDVVKYYTCGEIYGFYDDEPNLSFTMTVTSFDDLAYSVSLNGKEYVLPNEWFEKLQADN